MQQGDLFADPQRGGAEAPSEGAAQPGPQDTIPAIARIAWQFERRNGAAVLPTRVTAALRRMDPGRISTSAWALMPVLVGARLPVEAMDTDRLRRWALLVHMVALLSGTGGVMAHRSGLGAGRAIHAADYSELRFMRLLSARGPALADQVVRLARFLVSKGAVPLDLRPLAELVLGEGRDEERAEAARLSLARGYYTAAAAHEAGSE